MDSDAAFVLTYLEEEVRRIRKYLAFDESLVDARGGSFLRLSEELLDHLLQQARDTVQDDTADTGAIQSRALLRLVPTVLGANEFVARYRDDVGRDDLPVGLLYFIGLLVDTILEGEADPLVHLGPGTEYATEPLAGVVRELAPGIETRLEKLNLNPVVFHLPQVAPANFLLTPILVHEVAHTAVEDHLYDDLVGRWDRTAIKASFDHNFAAYVKAHQLNSSRIPDHQTEWRERLARWTDEFLCDALGVVLMGPSYLFALAVFLPAPAHGSLDSHPYPSDRIDLCLRHLDNLGWTAILESNVPDILSWCRELAANPHLSDHPQESFLREVASLAQPHFLETVRSHLPPELDPDLFDDYDAQLIRTFEAGVPAVEFAGRAALPWEIVLGGWFAALKPTGGSPTDLVHVAASETVNALLTKCVELASIKRLWDETP